MRAQPQPPSSPLIAVGDGRTLSRRCGDVDPLFQCADWHFVAPRQKQFGSWIISGAAARLNTHRLEPDRAVGGWLRRRPHPGRLGRRSAGRRYRRRRRRWRPHCGLGCFRLGNTGGRLQPTARNQVRRCRQDEPPREQAGGNPKHECRTPQPCADSAHAVTGAERCRHYRWCRPAATGASSIAANTLSGRVKARYSAA